MKYGLDEIARAMELVADDFMKKGDQLRNRGFDDWCWKRLIDPEALKKEDPEEYKEVQLDFQRDVNSYYSCWDRYEGIARDLRSGAFKDYLDKALILMTEEHEDYKY